MNNLDNFNQIKSIISDSSKDLKGKLFDIIDENSLVEFNAFSHVDSDKLNGLGLITGFATIDSNPIYVIAQNSKVLNGGLSVSNIDKMIECLNKAEQTSYPVLFVFDSLGAVVSDGVKLLDKIGQLVEKVNDLKGIIPLFCLAIGNVYGSSSVIASICDYTYVVGDVAVSYHSKLVKNEMLSNFIKVKAVSEVKDLILNYYNIYVTNENNELELNATCKELAKGINDKSIVKLFDNKPLTMFDNIKCNITTLVGKVGGESLGVILFNDNKDGVSLTLNDILKIKYFANHTQMNSIPLVSFVNISSLEVDNSVIYFNELSNMLYALSDNRRISFAFGKCVGLGYSMFMSKAFGNLYTFAMPDCMISPLTAEIGTMNELKSFDKELVEKNIAKYEDKFNSLAAANQGCVDNIIDPEFIRQYLISTLQMIG